MMSRGRLSPAHHSVSDRELHLMTGANRHTIIWFTFLVGMGSLGTRVAAGAGVLAFKGVRVFDGTRVIPEATVVVRDGLIAAVGADAEVPTGATLAGRPGTTLIPGMIDAHTHTSSAEQLKSAAIFGVTTELDMFTMASLAAQRRAEQAAGKAEGRADLLSAGTLVTAPGGHGTEYGFKIPTIALAAEAENFVKARIAEGSDYIKIVYDDGAAVGLHWNTIAEPTLAAVIRAARAGGKLTVVHALPREFARRAVAAGADGLAHLWIDKPVDDAFVRLAVERRVFIIPTLTVLDSISGAPGRATLADDPALAPYLTGDEARMLRARFPRPVVPADARQIPHDALKALKAAGVRILAGTDCGNRGTAHGASLHRELELLVAAGLTPAEALAAATALTADAFGLTDRGRVTRGVRADLVLIDGDPTADIRATRKIVGVWKQGHAIDRDAYRAAIGRQLEAMARARSAPAPPGSEPGLISDFEGEEASKRAAFGAGWTVSTDALMGGKSEAGVTVVAGGADGSAHCLKINGTIDKEPGTHWAGVWFSPGAVAITPANLSGKSGLSFWARGDGKRASVMVFSQARGFAPATRTFVAGDKWQRFRFDWKDFDGLDGALTLGIFFGGGSEPGAFELQIDDVRLEPAAAK
jgi:imidazolonepropionase-like amidohydrolase